MGLMHVHLHLLEINAGHNVLFVVPKFVCICTYVATCFFCFGTKNIHEYFGSICNMYIGPGEYYQSLSNVRVAYVQLSGSNSHTGQCLEAVWYVYGNSHLTNKWSLVILL